jgi:ATP-dependent DNA ligase
VIGGFTAPRGARTDLGALLVRHFDGDRFRSAGKVGTGFTRATLRELSDRFAPLIRQTSPFDPDKGIPRAATWVEPVLVAQVAFMQWTPDGRLRRTQDRRVALPHRPDQRGQAAESRTGPGASDVARRPDDPTADRSHTAPRAPAR